MKVFVIDSSTCLKWVLKDEVNYKIAQLILKDYLEGKIALVAPNLWVYEVANGLNSAVLSKRITISKAKRLLGLIIKTKPNLLPMEPVIQKCLKNSNKYKISIYDSVYISLAEEHKISLLSSDKKLISKVKSPKLMQPIENYQTKASFK
ncbi:MAG: type II toxin-antitoxin system VapC family toxin [Patescibacteria group bacterium]